MKIMMIPGFSWAKSVGPKLPKLPDGSCPAWCPATHFRLPDPRRCGARDTSFGYLQGTCKINFEDGTSTTINAGDSSCRGQAAPAGDHRRRDGHHARHRRDICSFAWNLQAG